MPHLLAVDPNSPVRLGFAYLQSAMAMVEPDMTVWLFDLAGALAGVMNGPRRRLPLSAAYFVVGAFTGFIFEHVVDHLGWHPAEAFMGGILSDDLIAAVRAYVLRGWPPFNGDATMDAELFQYLSPFRPELVAIVPKLAWVALQIGASGLGLFLLLRHKEYEHIFLPLGPMHIFIWLSDQRKALGPFALSNLITWACVSYAGLVYFAVLLDGIAVAADARADPRPIASLVAVSLTSMIGLLVRLKAHVHGEALRAVANSEIAPQPADAEITALMEAMMKEAVAADGNPRVRDGLTTRGAA